MKLKKIKQFVDELEKKKLKYIVIAGVGLDGKRGHLTRSHQDLDVLCLKKDLPKIETILKDMGYSGKKYNNLYKVFDKNGGKIDIGMLENEGKELVSYGRIAITRFPQELFYKPQKGYIEKVKFNIAPNELLKKWGSQSKKLEDAMYAKTLPVNPNLYKKIKRALRKGKKRKK